MGQAKRRGSREDRIQQALERRHEEEQAKAIVAEAKRRQYAEWYAGLGEAERAEEDRRVQRKIQRTNKAMMLMAISAALGGGHL